METTATQPGEEQPEAPETPDDGETPETPENPNGGENQETPENPNGGDVYKRQDDLTTIIESVMQAKTANFNLEFDPTLVRGMSYYTGPIFEISIDGFAGSVGAVSYTHLDVYKRQAYGKL